MRAQDLVFGPPRDSPAIDAGLLILRVAAGLAIALLHGFGKVPPSPGLVGMIGGMGFPAPGLFAWLAAIAEFGGGLLLAIGLLTRPAALLLFGHFAIVVLIVHAGDTIGDRELPIIFWAIALHFLLTGPGRYSIDAMIRGRTDARRY
jgi:putative oxidoreductase